MKREEAEVWLPIAGHEGVYAVSDLGRVKRLAHTAKHIWRGKVRSVYRPELLMKPTPNAGGYPCVSLSSGGKGRTHPVHRLVLFAFVGPAPDGLQCAHLNGNQQDARLCNLAWVSAQENADHKREHGTNRKGEEVANSVLTESQVLQIAALRGKIRAPLCAESFGIGKNTVNNIWLGKTWSHLTGWHYEAESKEPLFECQYCGSLTQRKHYRQRFCTDKHRHQFRNEKIRATQSASQEKSNA